MRPHHTKSSKPFNGDVRGERINPSGAFSPLGEEGLRLIISEEFLTKFVRSDSRSNTPVPTLVKPRSCNLECYRRCVTPDSLYPIFISPPLKMCRSKSEGEIPSSSLFDFRKIKASESKKVNRRKSGRSETDFSTKLSKQFDLAAKSRTSGIKNNANITTQKNQGKEDKVKSRKNAVKETQKQQSQEPEGKTVKKKGGGRKGKKKTNEGGLDDPGQTAVSTLPDSRGASSSHSHSSSASSRRPSSHSSKSGSAKRAYIKDPLSYDPKQFLSEGHKKEDDTDLAALHEASQNHSIEGDTFWLSLPRTPSRSSAVFSLPVQLKRLEAGITSLQYLQKYLTIQSSRKRLHRTVFKKYKDTENIRMEQIALDTIPQALADGLGETLSEALLEKCKRYAVVGNVSYIQKDHFLILAGLSERFYCEECMCGGCLTETEPRDLVEQLDFMNLSYQIEDLALNPILKELLEDVERLT